jgi:hypothetical protein
VVSKRRKVQLLACALTDCLAWSRRPIDARALAEVSFLVDAVAAAPAPVRRERQAGIGGMVNVIHAMAERDRDYRIRTTRGCALGDLAEAEWTASSS